MALCSWDGCDLAARKRGFCDTHYERLRRTGQLTTRPKDQVVRFWLKVNKTEGCWVWTAAKTRWGYGYVRFDGRNQHAHRVAYKLLKGQIPENRELDHLCRNRACVNPEHLEAVSRRTNLLRGEGVSAVHAAKTHCVNGHEFTPENTYEWRGTRNCKVCREAATARRDRARPAPVVIEKPCTICGSIFSYERLRGAQPKLCSDTCREEQGRRASREFQRRARAAKRG